jgi:hypothetical protein
MMPSRRPARRSGIFGSAAAATRFCSCSRGDRRTIPDWWHGEEGREYRGLRTKRYTYVRALAGPWLLFDNLADPYQMDNLIGEPEYAGYRYPQRTMAKSPAPMASLKRHSPSSRLILIFAPERSSFAVCASPNRASGPRTRTTWLPL